MDRGVLGILLCGVLTATVNGQDQGPVTITTARDYEGLVISDLETALRFEFRYNNDEVDRIAGVSQRDTERSLREILELSLNGYAGHPNLFEFKLSSELWLTQTDVDLAQGMGDSSDGVLLGYDATGTLFKESDLPITLYGRQTINDINRQFGGSLTNIVTEYGVLLDIRDEVFPTQIEVFRREQKQEDILSNTDFTIDQYTFRAEGRAIYTENQQLWWDVTYDTVSESGNLSLAQDFDRLEANLTHTLDFGDSHQHQLRSTARIYHEQGDRDFTQYRLSERVRFKHSDSLTSRIDYIGQISERDAIKQQRHELLGQVEHQFFDSLVTIARAGYRRQDIPTENFNSNEIFGNVTLDYTKKVPFGTLFAGLDLSTSHLDESPRGSVLGLVGQLFVFSASGVITLNERNIDPNSIVVRDTAGLMTYSEGADYIVVQLATSTEIHRVIGGNISAGQAALVDYDIGPDPGGVTDTFGVGFSFRYTLAEGPLRGLSLYTRIFDQDEQRSQAFFTGEEIPENDFTSVVFGSEYTRGRLYGRVEYENRESTLDPFAAWRLEGRYLHRIDAHSNVVLNAYFQSLERAEAGITSETLTLSARVNHQFTDRLRGSALVLWQDEHTSFGGDTQGFEQELSLQWGRGQTNVVARFRNTMRNAVAEDTMFQTLYIGIRREF